MNRILLLAITALAAISALAFAQAGLAVYNGPASSLPQGAVAGTTCAVVDVRVDEWIVYHQDTVDVEAGLYEDWGEEIVYHGNPPPLVRYLVEHETGTYLRVACQQ